MSMNPEKTDRSESKLVLDGVPPKRPIWVRLLKFAAWATLTGATAAVVAVVGVYYHFSQGLPDIPKVDQYWPPIVTEVDAPTEVTPGISRNRRHMSS